MPSQLGESTVHLTLLDWHNVKRKTSMPLEYEEEHVFEVAQILTEMDVFPNDVD